MLKAFLTSLIYFDFTWKVVAFSRLFPRQDACDEFFCLDWSVLGASAQQTFDSIGAYLGRLFLQGQQDPQSPTIPTEQPLPGMDPDSSRPDSEFKIPTDTQTSPQILPLAGSEQCTQNAPPVGAPELTNDEDEIQNYRSCGVTTAYIIIPSDCGSPENTNVEQILLGTDPKFKTSRSPWCHAENGVMFWLGNLSPEQALDLKGRAGGAVKIVMPDVPLRKDPLTPAPELMTQALTPSAAGTDGRLKLRDLLEVRFRNYRSTGVSDPSLTFLSNAPEAPKENLKDYIYFKSAIEAAQAQEVRVYVIDTGFEKTNPDIPHNKLTYIYGLGCRTLPNDDDEEGGSSCVVSKIGGQRFGVFPNGPAFSIVKIGPDLSALFDSLGLVIRDIIRKPYMKGRAVVHISGQWPIKEINRDAINLLQQGIKALLSLKAMIVAPAGSVDEGEQMTPNIPADLAQTTDFIIAGAVVPFETSVNPSWNPAWFGQRIPGTLTGPAVTVSAPGSGFCYAKGTSVKSYTGSGIAAAVMTGLVAYFLAIPDLHRYFMAQPDFGLAVKQYVIAMSYPRNGLVRAVWNGLDARDTRTVYNEPGGEPWIGIPYTGNPRFQ